MKQTTTWDLYLYSRKQHQGEEEEFINDISLSASGSVIGRRSSGFAFVVSMMVVCLLMLPTCGGFKHIFTYTFILTHILVTDGVRCDSFTTDYFAFPPLLIP